MVPASRPNKVGADIRDRMPVILRQEAYRLADSYS
jgi:hypothetical protein